MDDESGWSTSEHNAVVEVVPRPDTATAWSELSERLRRDRRRRRVGRGVAATVVVGLAATMTVAGLSARAGDDREVTSMGPASAPAATTASTDTTSTTEFDMSRPPDVDLSAGGDLLRITCADGVGSLERTVVAAGRNGLPIELWGGSHVMIVDPVTGENLAQPIIGGRAIPDGQLVPLTVAPGTYGVVCGSPTDAAIVRSPIGTFEVTDPNGYYTPGNDWPSPGCVDARSESFDLGGQTIDEFLAWRFGVDHVPLAGYVGADRRGLVVPGATGTVYSGKDGPIRLHLFVCDGAAPLPPGDGLTSASTVRTDEEAAAWLEAHLPPTGLFALPAGAAIEGMDARLVRMDEANGYGLHATAPGTSGWIVSVAYASPGGAAGTAIYSFPAQPGPEEIPTPIGDVGGEPTQVPGGFPDFPTWFASLVDHAS
jgi:hypothetical protein